MLFDGWPGIGRTLFVGTLAYAALILLLRVSGKRTLSKMNAFDLVVTVALGSTLATVLLSKSVALAEGVTGFALLVVLQFGMAWLSVRSRMAERWLKGEPALLFHCGEFLPSRMKQERITEEEVRAAVRAQGIADLVQVDAVVLETDGSITVLPHTEAVERPVLVNEDS